MSSAQDKVVTERVTHINCVECDKLLDVSHLPSFTSINCPECGTKQIIPAQFGPFILLGRLGAGGMGVIYHAEDKELGRRVALKVMQKSLGENPEFVDSFKREARAAAALNHRNVVQIYSFGQHEGQPYIVMELVDGGRLDEIIVEEERLDEVRALEIHIEVAEGLKAASDVGLIHSDIKPANILFGSNGEAKVVDFGLASFIGQQDNNDGQIWGTPFYIAPEKARRQKIDFRSDIYSLGATLFHALAGKPPFDGPTPLDVVLARLNASAPALSAFRDDLHSKTIAMVARMLEGTPTMRYPSYPALLYDMREALEAAREPIRSASRTKLISGIKPIEENKSRKRLLIAGIALGVILLVGGAVVGNRFYQQHKEQVAAEAAEQDAFKKAKERGEQAFNSAQEFASKISAGFEKVNAYVEQIKEKAEKIEDAASLMENIDVHIEKIKQTAEAVPALLEQLEAAHSELAAVSESKAAVEKTRAIRLLADSLRELYGESNAALVEAGKFRDAIEEMHQQVLKAAAEEQERLQKAQELAKKREEERRKREEAERLAQQERDEVAQVRRKAVQSDLDIIDAARANNAAFIAQRNFDAAAASFVGLMSRLSMPEAQSHYKDVMSAYKAMSDLKRFVITSVRESPYKEGWLFGTTRRDIVDADAREGLKIALGSAGSTFISWEQMTIPQFLQVALYYVKTKGLPNRAQADIYMAMSLFCYESADFKSAERAADLACNLNPQLRRDVERMMPGLLTDERSEASGSASGEGDAQ